MACQKRIVPENKGAFQPNVFSERPTPGRSKRKELGPVDPGEPTDRVGQGLPQRLERLQTETKPPMGPWFLSAHGWLGCGSSHTTGEPTETCRELRIASESLAWEMNPLWIVGFNLFSHQT